MTNATVRALNTPDTPDTPDTPNTPNTPAPCDPTDPAPTPPGSAQLTSGACSRTVRRPRRA